MRYSTCLFLFCSLAAVLVPLSLNAQHGSLYGGSSSEPSGMGYPQLIGKIQQSNMAEAMPYLLELVRRIEGETEPASALENLLASSYFELSRYHFNQYAKSSNSADMESCIDFGKRLRERFPRHVHGATTLTFEIQMLFAEKQWDRLVESLEFGLKGVEGGLFSSGNRRVWLEKMCTVYAVRKQWTKGEPRFIQWFNDPLTSQHNKARAAIYLIMAYEEMAEPEKVLPFIPSIVFAKEDRYDPELNLALFKLGNQFSDKEDYSSANYLYFLCLTLEDIIEFNEKHLRSIEARSQWYVNSNASIPEELSDQKSSKSKFISELKEQTSYTGPLKYHRARNLERMGRRYDAFFAYLRLVREHPEHKRSQLFHYTAFNQAIEVGYSDEAIELGESYIAKSNYENYRREVFVKLIQTYSKLENYAKVHQHGKAFMLEFPEHEYALQVVHFMSYAWLRMNDLDSMRSVVGGYLNSYPNAPLSQSAHYWLGVADIIEQEFEAGIHHFDHVITNFPDGSFFIEASFRRAVCEFGLGDYETAGQLLEAWVASYPTNALRGEAEVLLGDIDAYFANIEEALAHYKSVEQFTRKMNLVDHAYFESARLLEANEDYDGVIKLLELYSETFQDEGNLTRAVYKIGNAYEMTGQPDVMLESYFAAIVRYGNNPHADGVDDIIIKFSEKYNEFVDYYSSTEAFAKRMLVDQDFRLELMDDRKKLHLFRMDNPQIDKDLLDALLRDKDLRHGLSSREIPQTEEEIELGLPVKYETAMLPEAKASLDKVRADFAHKLSRFPSVTPEERFKKLFTTVRAESQRTFELRLFVAFDALGIAPPRKADLSVQDISHASAATLAWIGYQELESDPELSQLAVDAIFESHPFSLAVPDALRLQAEVHLKNGEADEAIALFDQIFDQHPLWPDAPEVTLRAAEIRLERGDHDDARARLQTILQVRDWRGAVWAEACYLMGKSFEQTGEVLKAHGFYERTYLTYRQFKEWAGKALYADGLLLEGMNETEDARSVYAQYLALPGVENLPNYIEVKKRKNAL